MQNRINKALAHYKRYNGVRICRVKSIDIILSKWFLLMMLVMCVFDLFNPLALVKSIMKFTLLFGSVAVHELSHSLMSMYYGAKVMDIRLYPIGGVARISDFKFFTKPKQEFFITIVGPASNIAMAAIALYLSHFIYHIDLLKATFKWFFMINCVLAVFNMLPMFPADGGRIFRALVSWWLKDYVRATKIACICGAFVLSGLFIFGITIGAYNIVIIAPLIGFMSWTEYKTVKQYWRDNDTGWAKVVVNGLQSLRIKVLGKPNGKTRYR